MNRPVFFHLLRNWCAALLLAGGIAQGQEIGFPTIRNYTPREYKASSANYAAAQDLRGLMYFGNYRGVLEFDGRSWQLIQVPNRSAVLSVSSDSSGQIFVGAVGDFGLLEPDRSGQMRFRSLAREVDSVHRPQLGGVQAIGIQRGAIFISYETNLIYTWDGTLVRHFPLAAPDEHITAFFLWNRLWMFSETGGLLEWKGGQYRPVPGGEQLKGYTVLAAVVFAPDLMLVRTLQGGFLLLDHAETRIRVRRFPTQLDQVLDKSRFSTLLALQDGQFMVGTVQDGAFIMDQNGRPVRHMGRGKELQDNLIINGFQDRNGSLWLTLSKGISRVEVASPLSHWNENTGLRGIVFGSVRHKGRIYAATPLGIFYMDGNRFLQIPGIDSESWRLVEVKLPGEAAPRLLATTLQGVYEIQDTRAVPIAAGSTYFQAYQSPSRPERLYLLPSSTSLAVIEFRNGRWTSPVEVQGLSGRFRNILEMPGGDLWLGGTLVNGRVTRVRVGGSDGSWSAEVLGRYDAASGLPAVNSIISFNGAPAFATDGGLYRYDGSADRFVPDQMHPMLGPAGITTMTEDPEGNLWMRRQLGNRRWLEWVRKYQDGTFARDSVQLSELFDAEVWGNIFVDASGQAWIGTPEGLYVFNARQQRARSLPFPPVVRRVVLHNDSLLYAGACGSDSLSERPCGAASMPVLSASNNYLTFDFAAPYFDQESGVRYSYYLKGHDAGWSAWTEDTRKEYARLPPGLYEFQVKARNTYSEESEAAIFAFRIRPPWYQTIWAYLSYGLAAIFLVYGTVKLNTQRLHLQNENLERLVFERTNEIWEQHKEIVKKTVALKRQKEEIAAQHGLLEQKNAELQEAMAHLKAAQSQLIESEKMASLGQLTAGIAHEINNPINFVKGNVGPLKRDFDEIKALFAEIQALRTNPDPAKAVEALLRQAEASDAEYLFEEMDMLLKGIEEGAVRTKEIVDGLKIFSRSDTDSFKLADIHDGLDATLRLLNNKTKDRIRVERDYAQIPLVECMPGKLNQVFMNIAVNAIQAMEAQAAQASEDAGRKEIGTLFIKTELLENCMEAGGGCVRISIRDTGPGIPEEIRSRIFDPFFTTKDVGEGTGLGLAISFGIIEKHQGRIEAESGPGEGTVFMISLPLRQPAAA
ncbi:MAG: ATP-binding protein [Bacteroidia bacterium]|nr:ATP-binding protein [Bacteroidia bacterium]